MKEIVKFCDKTISETTAHINSPEKALKQNMEKEEFQKIKKRFLGMKKQQNES